MCGIAGWFSPDSPDPAEGLLARMLQEIAHRGPDGRGMLFFDEAALGHVRLAVIDPSGGRQPMSTPDGRWHLSYNGELYNFQEIRKELESAGHTFQTSSDTEVVLLAYQHFGLEAFNRFRGMFALALWDNERQEGILVRDRYGIKPLFYTTTGRRLIFGSEIKGILPALTTRPGLDLNSLHLLMNFRYIPGDRTLFERIYHLPPGHCLQWRDGRQQMHKWASPLAISGSGTSAAHKKEEISGIVDRIRCHLEQAVARQLVSDVPLGLYLSAGLDSATVLALTAKKQGAATPGLPTFTIQTGDSPLEAGQAAQTARLFGVRNFQEPLHLDIEYKLPWLIRHLEVPKVNALQSAFVAHLARKHVTVALSGLGGDEIFLGYNMHRFLARLDNLGSEAIQKMAKLAGVAGKNVFGRLGLHYDELKRGGQMLEALPDFPRIYGIIRNVWDSPAERRKIYGPRLLAADPEEAQGLPGSLWPKDEADPVAAAAAFEIQHKMVNDLLLQEDRLSMAFGLEVRVPFLDEDLVALLSGIDRRLKMPNGRLKKLMREVVAPWLPDEILNRPKSGFQVPIEQFFNTHLRPLCPRYLSRKRLTKDGLFNPDFVETVLNARPHYRLRWHYFLLYLMLGTNIWLEIFTDETGASSQDEYQTGLALWN